MQSRAGDEPSLRSRCTRRTSDRRHRARRGAAERTGSTDISDHGELRWRPGARVRIAGNASIPPVMEPEQAAAAAIAEMEASGTRCPGASTNPRAQGRRRWTVGLARRGASRRRVSPRSPPWTFAERGPATAGGAAASVTAPAVRPPPACASVASASISSESSPAVEHDPPSVVPWPAWLWPRRAAASWTPVSRASETRRDLVRITLDDACRTAATERRNSGATRRTPIAGTDDRAGDSARSCATERRDWCSVHEGSSSVVHFPRGRGHGRPAATAAFAGAATRTRYERRKRSTASTRRWSSGAAGSRAS